MYVIHFITSKTFGKRNEKYFRTIFIDSHCERVIYTMEHCCNNYERIFNRDFIFIRIILRLYDHSIRCLKYFMKNDIFYTVFAVSEVILKYKMSISIVRRA